jgi:hypothetical protein
MPTNRLGSRARRGIVGQLIPEALAVSVSDPAGAPRPNVQVTFETDPEGSAEFAPGERSYATVLTGTDGIAAVQIRPTDEGPFTIRVKADGNTEGLFSVAAVTIPRHGGTPPVIDARRGPRNTPSDPPLRGWPLAAVILTAVTALLLWALFGGNDASSKPAPPPTPPPKPVVTTSKPHVDTTARKGVARLESEVGALKTDVERKLARERRTRRRSVHQAQNGAEVYARERDLIDVSLDARARRELEARAEASMRERIRRMHLDRF